MHCVKIRAKLREGMDTVYTKRQGRSPAQCRGGAQLSIDLSQAFDMLPRDVFRDALLHCGVDEGLVNIILHLHGQWKYHIQHGKFATCVSMKRGVRQGCTLAPALFAAFTAWFPNEGPHPHSQKYLGVVMSYGAFELQTFLQSFTLNKHRLGTILHSSRALSIRQRVRLHLICIRPSLNYGLHAMGLATSIVRKVEVLEMQHLRAIAKSPVHITRESNACLLQRLKVSPPHELL